MAADELVSCTRPIPELGGIPDELARDPQHALLLRQHTYDVDRLYSRLREQGSRLDSLDAFSRDLLVQIQGNRTEISRLAGHQAEQRTMLVDLDGKLDRNDARQQDMNASLQSLTNLLHATNGLLTNHVQEEAESQAHLTKLFHRAVRVLLAVFVVLAAVAMGQSATGEGPAKLLPGLLSFLG